MTAPHPLLLRGIQVVTGVALIAVAGVAVVAPRNSWFEFRQPVVWLVLVFCLGLGAGLAAVGPRVPRPRPWRAVLAGTAVATPVTILLGLSALYYVGWDSQHVARSAVALALDDSPWPEPRWTYFARYPNNVLLLWTETLTIRVGDAVGLSWETSLMVGQALLVGLVVACLGATAAVVGHPRRIWPVQALATVLLGTGPLVAMPYSDIPGAACVAVAVLASALAARSWGRWQEGESEGRRAVWVAWALSALVAAGLACAFKPVGVALPLAAAILLTAWAAVALVGRRWAPVVTALLGLLVIGAVSWGTAAVSQQVARWSTGMTDSRLAGLATPQPVELWLAQGTFDSGDPSPVREWGGFDLPLTVEASEAAPDRAASLLRQRAWEHVTSRTVAENLWFHGNKVAWVWGDGTFWAFGEGHDRTREPTYTDGVLGTLAPWNVGSGEHYVLRASIVQGVWLATVLAAGAALVRARPQPLLAWCALALILISGYLALFQARSRYLVPLIPVLLAVLVIARWRNAREPMEGHP